MSLNITPRKVRSAMAHKPQPARLTSILLLIFCTISLAASQNCQCETDDLYVIRSVGPNGLVLDAADPDQIRVQQFNGSDTQLWRIQPAGTPGIYYIINEHRGKALDYILGDDGFLHLAVSDLHRSSQQRWHFDQKRHIVNAAIGKNVDIDKAKFTAGNRVIVWEDNGCHCQRFILQKNVTGVHKPNS